jgi:hypothetical protein
MPRHHGTNLSPTIQLPGTKNPRVSAVNAPQPEISGPAPEPTGDRRWRQTAMVLETGGYFRDFQPGCFESL